MNQEKKAYNLFRKHCKRKSDRMDRVENIVMAGMPDINYVVDGYEGWIELKAPTEPKNPTTRLFTGHSHNLTQVQKNWFLKQRNALGTAYILIITDKQAFLVDGQYADHINEMTANQIKEICSWHANRPFQAVDWDLLHLILGRR